MNNKINWTLEDGTLVITKDIETTFELSKEKGDNECVIPNFRLEDKMDAPWSERKNEITQVVIGEDITEIGTYAFENCENLKSVILPKSLVKIHSYAFANCVNLKNIETIRTDFKYIYDKRESRERETITFGIETFENTPWLADKFGNYYRKGGTLFCWFSPNKEVVIPDGTTALAPLAFYNRTVDRIYFPESLGEIQNLAFLNTTFRNRIDIPKWVKKIELQAFNGCEAPFIGLHPSWKKKQLQNFKCDSKIGHSYRLKGKYSVAIRGTAYKDFKKFLVLETKETEACKIDEDRECHIGKEIWKRMKQKNIFYCIKRKQGVIDSIHAYEKINKILNTYKEYTLYAEGKTGVKIVESEEKWSLALIQSFDIATEECVRVCEEGYTEEWLVSKEGNVMENLKKLLKEVNEESKFCE